MAKLKGQTVAYCKSYPGIGIARVGNSPDEFFIGPEAPGEAGIPLPDSFRDARGRMKRQAARFRVYAFNDKDEVIQEVTADDAEVEWTVHLANKKGAWYYLGGRYNQAITKLRNPEAQADAKHYANPDLRTDLIIDPGPCSIGGKSRSGVRFDGGSFMGTEVPLGELRTDDAGRLLVLGGLGKAASVADPPLRIGYPLPGHNPPLGSDRLNNPTWWDDTSDGSVRARIRFPDDEETVAAVPSWVLVVPPKYAPFTSSVVTLYDIMEDVFVTDLDAEAQDVEFYRDVFPVLYRVSQLAWVSHHAFEGHGPGAPGDFQLLQARLSFNGEGTAALRRRIFERIRAPAAFVTPAERYLQANPGYMPYLYGSWYGPLKNEKPDPRQWLTVTNSMYAKLRSWAEGRFTAGLRRPSMTFDKIPVTDQPAALDRASLEPAVGGPFAPGIEITYIASNRQLYSELFRFTNALTPGDATKYMSLPWQDDFAACGTGWWPAQRPDDVLPEQDYGRNPLSPGQFKPWARGLKGEPDKNNVENKPANLEFAQSMVEHWSELGFVLPRTAHYPPGANPEPGVPVNVAGGFVYVETERTLPDDGE